jgi:hypothetical protein
MSEERKALQKYKIEGRQALVTRIAQGAKTAIDTLVAAAEEGDIRASEIILKKVLPDLKAVDISHSGDGVKIIINQRVYQGKGKAGERNVELPQVNISITERKKEKEFQEIDVTPYVAVSEPPEKEKKNYAQERSQGVFR